MAQPALVDETRDSQTQREAIGLADSLGIRVATLDTGLWVLGARFARSPSRMGAALLDMDRFRQLVDEELRRAESAVGPLRELAESV